MELDPFIHRQSVVSNWHQFFWNKKRNKERKKENAAFPVSNTHAAYCHFLAKFEKSKNKIFLFFPTLESVNP